jgi:hypothetical protein
MQWEGRVREEGTGRGTRKMEEEDGRGRWVGRTWMVRNEVALTVVLVLVAASAIAAAAAAARIHFHKSLQNRKTSNYASTLKQDPDDQDFALSAVQLPYSADFLIVSSTQPMLR